MSESSTSFGRRPSRAASISPQFSRSSGGIQAQAERGVDFLLGLARHALLIVDAEQAVFVEREAQLQGARAQDDVVFLAAGEVLHGRAVAFVRQRAQIHLQAFQSVLDAGLVGAFAEHCVSFGVVDEALERFGGARAGDQQIEIADGFLAAAQAAGGRDLIDAAGFRKIRDQFVGGFLAEAQQEAAGALAVLRDGSEHLLFELGAHARQLAQLLLLADALQIVDGGDFVMLVEQRDAFGAEALDVQQVEERGRELLRASCRAFRTTRVCRFRPAPRRCPCRCRGCR